MCRVRQLSRQFSRAFVSPNLPQYRGFSCKSAAGIRSFSACNQSKLQHERWTGAKNTELDQSRRQFSKNSISQAKVLPKESKSASEQDSKNDESHPKRKRKVLRKLTLSTISIALLIFAFSNDEFEQFVEKYSPASADFLGYIRRYVHRSLFPIDSRTQLSVEQLRHQISETLPPFKQDKQDNQPLSDRVENVNLSDTVTRNRLLDDNEAASGEIFTEKRGPLSSERRDQNQQTSAAISEIACLKPDSDNPEVAIIIEDDLVAEDNAIRQSKDIGLAGATSENVMDQTEGNAFVERTEKAIDLLADTAAEEAINAVTAAETKARADATAESEHQIAELQTELAILQRELETERDRLELEYSEKLGIELEKRQRELEKDQRAILSSRLEYLQKAMERKIKTQVESERGQRLGRLAAIESNLLTLESAIDAITRRLSEERDVSNQAFVVESMESAWRDGQLNELQDGVTSLRQLAQPDNLMVLNTLDLMERLLSKGAINLRLELLDAFEPLSRDIERVALLPADASTFQHASAWLMDKMMFKQQNIAIEPTSLDKKEGNNFVPSVLARARASLEIGDLDMAVRELNQLEGWPRHVANGWIQSARENLEFDQALRILKTETNLQRVKA